MFSVLKVYLTFATIWRMNSDLPSLLFGCVIIFFVSSTPIKMLSITPSRP